MIGGLCVVGGVLLFRPVALGAVELPYFPPGRSESPLCCILTRLPCLWRPLQLFEHPRCLSLVQKGAERALGYAWPAQILLDDAALPGGNTPRAADRLVSTNPPWTFPLFCSDLLSKQCGRDFTYEFSFAKKF